MKIRHITGIRTQIYAKYASKAIHYNLVDVKTRKAYFDAVKTLRSIADEYCNISGISIE